MPDTIKSQARVVVVGGGVQGVSLLYHLAKKGWKDVVLCERTELTAGSTWHAAGLLPLFIMDYSAGRLHQYSIDLYNALEAETGQDVSFHVTGNLRLAKTRERMDEFKKYCGIANTIGVPFEMITPKQVKEIWPLCEVDDLAGAIYHPQDGHIAPVDLTSALAKGARMYGAEIYQHTPVVDIKGTGKGTWMVKTSKGDIEAEHVVLATGFYAREIGAKIGLDIPAIPVEHQYIVTEEHPSLVERRDQGLPELPVLRDADHAYYMREERSGLIIGPYENNSRACFVNGVPEGFGKELFPGDIDRLIPHFEAAQRRVPLLNEVGIKDIVNGPIQFTPDGNPLVGPAWGLKNLWLSEGHTYGITSAGGMGNALAEWIVNGEPPVDMWGMDPRRYGDYADKGYVREKNEECYSHMYVLHYPDEERPRARNKKKSRIHDKLAARGAVWGARYGWERANWFAPEGEADKEVWSFRRSPYFPFVAEEAKRLRESSGLIELTGFSKFLVEGPQAEAWLNGLVANRVPTKNGRMSLAHALTSRGGVRSEFTITRLSDETFYIVSSGGAERYDWDFLQKLCPEEGVKLRNITLERGTLVLAGPNSRKIMESTCQTGLDNANFPWLTSQVMTVAGQEDVYALRVNFVGELGWELHHPIGAQEAIFDALVETGEPLGMAMVGMRAMDSLRLEKSYRMWAQDLTADYTLLEAGLDRFVRIDKPGGFTGRDALVAQKEKGLPRIFVTLEVDNEVRGGRVIADPYGNEPLFLGDRMIGRVTSGGYGHCVGKTLVLAYIETEFGAQGTACEIEILRERFPARVIEESPWDPENKRLRA